MNISASMYSLAPTVKAEKWSVVDFIDYAHSISLQGVELLDIFWENSDDHTEEMHLVKETLKKYDMRVSAYDVSNNFVKADEAERAKDVAHEIGRASCRERVWKTEAAVEQNKERREEGGKAR